MKAFWTPWRLRWYPAAYLVAIAIGLVIVLTTASDAETLGGRLGGDFPSFFGAGTIVADGDIDQLYDLERQFTAQESLFPADDPGALFFSYPPYVAAGYRLLVPLGFRGAYALHTVLSLTALFGAIVLAEPLIGVLRKRRLIALAAALAFLPMAEGALLGQNVAFSLFLIVASWRLVVVDRPWAAGAVLGLLAYKPQLAIPLAGLYLLSGRWRVTVGAAVTGAAAFVASGAMMGFGWVSEWLTVAGEFRELDVDVNGQFATSAVGFFSNLGVGSIGWLIAAGVAGVLSYVWWRFGDDLPMSLAVACSGLVLMAPHAQSYEPGLMLLTLTVLIDRRGRGLVWLWPAAAGKLAGGLIGFNFTFFAVIAAFTMAVRLSIKGRVPT